MNKYRAAGIHLLLSSLIGLLLLTLMLGAWYPGPYFKLMGGKGLIFLMIGIDICLGPLLTFVVYKPNKNSLKFDLSVIALLQLSALLYGASVMFNTRPVFNVFTKDVFQVASATDIDNKELKLAKNLEWRKLPLTGPILLAAVEPDNIDDKQDVILAAASGIDWHQLPKLYVSYDSQRQNILRHAKPIAELRKISNDNINLVDKFVLSQNKPESDFVFVPIRAHYTEMAIILNAKNADYISILDAKT